MNSKEKTTAKQQAVGIAKRVVHAMSNVDNEAVNYAKATELTRAAMKTLETNKNKTMVVLTAAASLLANLGYAAYQSDKKAGGPTIIDPIVFIYAISLIAADQVKEIIASETLENQIAANLRTSH